MISHVANILQFLGPPLALVPDNEPARYWIHGLQLTLSDWVAEIHDIHHPIGPSLYYHQQQEEARRRAVLFHQQRLPRFLSISNRFWNRTRPGPTTWPVASIATRTCPFFRLSAACSTRFRWP